jgi:hypothetical protein
MELLELFSIASLRVLGLGEQAQLDNQCKAGLGQTILVTMDARTLFLVKKMCVIAWQLRQSYVGSSCRLAAV